MPVARAARNSNRRVSPRILKALLVSLSLLVGSYLESSRWKVNFVRRVATEEARLHRSNYWGVRLQKYLCLKKKKKEKGKGGERMRKRGDRKRKKEEQKGKRGGKLRRERRSGRKPTARFTSTTAIVAPLCRKILTTVCESFLRHPPKAPFFPALFSDIGRALALRPRNYGIVSRNGRVLRIFVQRNSRGERRRP